MSTARRYGLACAAILTVSLSSDAQGQDRSGILGVGLSYANIAGVASGVGPSFELASNINRVHSAIQYRLHISYVQFQPDAALSECTSDEPGTCALEAPHYGRISIEWAPVLQVGGGGSFRLRLAPIGVGFFVLHERQEVQQVQRALACFHPDLDARCPYLESFTVTMQDSGVGYGLRSGIELGVHIRPLVLQVGARWQHSFSGEPGYTYVPVSLGYFF